MKTRYQKNQERRLPMEIVEEIFLYLSTRDLLCYRCVCKWLKDYIDSPIFCQSHGSRRKNQLIVIRVRWGESNPFWGLDLNSLPVVEAIEANTECYFVDMQQFLSLVMPPELEKLEHCQIYAECDGMVLVGTRNNLWLWSPWLRRCRYIPPFPEAETGVTILGFGFGNYDFHYKIILVSETHNYKYEALVFSLVHFCWLKLGSFDFEPSFWSRISFSDGKFWMHSDNNSFCCWDVRTLEFQVVPVTFYDPANVIISNLQVYESKLCLKVEYRDEHLDPAKRKDDNKTYFDIYNKDSSCTRLGKFDPLYNRVLACSPDYILCIHDIRMGSDKHQLHTIDLQTGRTFRIHFGKRTTVVSCKERFPPIRYFFYPVDRIVI